MQNLAMRTDDKGQYTRTPQQELARAELLQRSFPNSVTELAALTAAQALAAHERRAGLIAQLHKQATGAADASDWQKILKARIHKDARRRKVTAWLLREQPLSWRWLVSLPCSGCDRPQFFLRTNAAFLSPPPCVTP